MYVYVYICLVTDLSNYRLLIALITRAKKHESISLSISQTPSFHGPSTGSILRLCSRSASPAKNNYHYCCNRVDVEGHTKRFRMLFQFDRGGDLWCRPLFARIKSNSVECHSCRDTPVGLCQRQGFCLSSCGIASRLPRCEPGQNWTSDRGSLHSLGLLECYSCTLQRRSEQTLVLRLRRRP